MMVILLTPVTFATLVTLLTLMSLVTLVTMFWSANQFYWAKCITVSGFLLGGFSSSLSATATTSTSLGLASSRARVTSIKFTKQELVSQ